MVHLKQDFSFYCSMLLSTSMLLVGILDAYCMNSVVSTNRFNDGVCRRQSKCNIKYNNSLDEYIREPPYHEQEENSCYITECICFGFVFWLRECGTFCYSC